MPGQHGRTWKRLRRKYSRRHRKINRAQVMRGRFRNIWERNKMKN